MNGRLLSLDFYEEGESIDQPLAYKQNVLLPNNNDQYGNERKQISLSAYFNRFQPVANSYGILNYEDSMFNELSEEGVLSND